MTRNAANNEPVTYTKDPASPEEWHCPYCGDEGGEPVTVYAREFQGEEGHGGMVEWADEGCSRCVKQRDPEDDRDEEQEGRWEAADDRFTEKAEEGEN